MKKLRSLLLVLLSVLFAVALAACGGDEEEETPVTKYTVTFETYGGTEIEPYSLEEGAIIERPADPTMPNFTFAGWYTDEERTQAFTFGQPMPAQDVTVHAKWTGQASSRIEYNSMGGSEVVESVGTVGSPLSEPQPPVYEGYRFGGWYREPEYNNLFAFTVYPAENLTLYAKWVGDPAYVYVEYIGNGSSIARMPVKRGEKIPEPDFFGEDIVCPGWYTDRNMTNAYAFDQDASSDVTLYASYYTRGLEFSGGNVTKYSGSSQNVIVPDRNGTSLILGISDYAFAEQTEVTTVVLPSTIGRIGKSAFYRCSYLTEINLTKNVATIGEYAFFDCSRLVSYGDITGVNEIPAGLFLGCKKLPAVTLSGNATRVGAQAFADCELLTEVTIPNRVTAVNDGLFDGCANLAKVTLPSALVSFGTNVFTGCGKLAEIELDRNNQNFKVLDGNLYRGETELLFYTCGTKDEKAFRLPDGATKIAAGAFDSNSTLESVEVRNAETVISCGAFANMKALTSLTIPALGGDTGYLAYYFGATEKESNVIQSAYIPDTLRFVELTGGPTIVGEYAFYGARGLEEVSGLEHITSIEPYAFAYTALKSFEIPETLSSLKNYAFVGCTELEGFNMAASSTAFSVYDGCLYNGSASELLFVPSVKTQIEFPATVQKIASAAFSESSIEEVTIPESVTLIAFSAFRGCSALTSLKVPFLGNGTDQITYLGYIFGAEVRLSEQQDEDGTSHMGMELENGSLIPPTLQTIEVTKKYAEIPDGAFAYFRGLKEVKFPEGNSITKIGHYAFYSTAFDAWDFNGIQEIGDGAFRSSSLQEVSLPASLTSFGYAAFAMIEPLEKITLAEGITEIGTQAFYVTGSTMSSASHGVALMSNIDCEVVIPSTVEKIGMDAFFGMGMMFDGTRKNIPNPNFSIRFAVNAEGATALTAIGDGAFAYSGLRTVEIPASVETVGLQAFLYCDALTSVTFGSATKTSELTKLGGLAFSGCTALTDFTMYVNGLVEMELYENKVSQTYSTYWDVFYSSSAKFTIYVPAGQVEAYKAAENWKTYENRIAAIGSAQGGGN